MYDSGSNNFTLEPEIYQQLHKEGLKSGYHFDWKQKSMAIWCFFHKIGLIFKAGLNVLGMKPSRVWHSALGRFLPVGVWAFIDEGDKPDNGPQESNSKFNEDDIDSDGGNDLESNHSSDSNSNPDEEYTEQEDKPENYCHRKTAYLFGRYIHESAH